MDKALFETIGLIVAGIVLAIAVLRRQRQRALADKAAAIPEKAAKPS